ncbi:MAG: dihydrofolate reductase [Bacteroidota bacterium]
MKISLVVAASKNNAIGKDNQMLWHLPKDMRFFKNTTWAMPVVMGRKTFESLSGKALSGRLNIVVTRQKDWKALHVTTVNSIEAAIEVAASQDYKELYIIGGADIYAQTLSMADTVYLTRVDTTIEADSYFPILGEEWEMVSEDSFKADSKHAFPFHFQVWEKIKGS